MTTAWTTSLSNSQLKTLVTADLGDNEFSYDEILAVLQSAAGGGITSSELSDLQSIYTNGTDLFESDYLKFITYSVVYENPANSKWWGGAKYRSDVDTLGNLAANTSATNADRLIDKWFLGQDLPMPIAGGDTATGSANYDSYSYATASGSLFVNGASAADVNQGQTGDCYLLASLGAIADADSSIITNAFIDNGNGTYGVKFYLDGEAVYTTVNKSIPVTSGGSAAFGSNSSYSLSGELWVSLFEKAYMQLNAQANIADRYDWTGESSYQALEGGWAYPLKEITNSSYKYYGYFYQSDAFSSGSYYSTNPLTYKQTIINALDAGGIGWMGSWGNTYGSNGKQNFVAGHAFMVLGYDSATDKFTFRNPWGSGSSWNAEFTASINDFWNSSVQGVLAITSPTTTDPVYTYTVSSAASTSGNAVTEGSAVTFTITRSSSGVASTVYVSTTAGTAGSGDFQALSKYAVSFSAYETSKTVSVNTYYDTLTEGNETFTLGVYKQATDASATASATAYIKDKVTQDFSYSITSNASSSDTAVAEGSNVSFTVTRSSSGSASTVYLSTVSGTAGSGDYAGLSQYALSFASYETSKTVNVATYLDGTAEGREYFSLALYKNLSDSTQSASATGYVKDQSLPAYGYQITSNAGSASSAVTEGSAITFTITRSGSGTDSTVYVSTVAGSAGATDYTAIEDQAVSFSANQKVATLTVDTLQDWWLDADEYFTLQLFLKPTDTDYVAYGSAFIADNPYSDYNYTITSTAETSGDAETEGGTVTFTITRSGSGLASTVYLSTAAGSAGSSDYEGLDQYALSFASYETSKTVTIQTTTDSLTEDTEYFWLNLYRNATDSTSAAYGTAYIADAAVADYSYTVSSSTTSSSAAAEGGTITFTITRSSSGSASTIYVSTTEGSADSSDYVALDKQALTFSSYETSKTVTVTTSTDTTTEGDEYFWLDLYTTYADALDYNWSTYGTGYIEDAASTTDYSYTISSNASYSSPIAEGSAVTFTITRNSSGSASTVYLSTYAGSAGSSDYVALDTYELDFAAYETSKTVTVNTNTDGTTEGNEYFFLELFKTYAAAQYYDWDSYGTAYIKDSTVADYSYTISSNASYSAPVTEGGTVTFTITRSSSGSASTVYLSTYAGSAGSSDYTALDKYELNFGASETSKTVTVNTSTDATTEGSEYFFLELFKTYADAQYYNWDSYGTAYIQDGTVANYSYTVTSNTSSGSGATEGSAVTFTITRSGSGSASTIYVSTTAGSAGSSDYTALDKYELSFAAGETSKTVTVNTSTDAVTESEEYFWLDLYTTYADALNYDWSYYGTGYIQDAATTDYTYTVASSASYSAPVTEGGTITFTITRNGSSSASTIYVSTSAGTAGSSDYTALDKYTVNFAVGETSKTVTVSTTSDSIAEAQEYFWLDLFETYADAQTGNWSSYGTAYIKSSLSALPGQLLADSSAGTTREAVRDTTTAVPPGASLSATATAASTTTSTQSTSVASYPGHGAGEFGNDYAFAALLTDGSVVTWGNATNGGNSASVSSQLTSVTHIYSTSSAFAALRSNGAVVTWGNDDAGGDSSAVSSSLSGTVDVTSIASTDAAFAALRTDGSVITWGSQWTGGDSSAVASKLNGSTDVTALYSNMSAFAALRTDGSVVTWGYDDFGGDSSAVASSIAGTVDVVSIYATGSAFAALRTDGSVITWGSSFDGGDSSDVATKLSGTTDVSGISATTSAFAALRSDGSVVTWGDEDNGGNSDTVASKLDGTLDASFIAATNSAFAALRTDGSVVTWGNASCGGDSSAVASSIDGTINVTKLYATGTAFAALRSDGSVVTWGYAADGGDSSSVASQLDGSIDVTSIVATDHAFAAIRTDGSVVTWGDILGGGDSSSLTTSLDGTIDVKSLAATSSSFSALRADGSVVTWGDTRNGGDSSDVASQLSGSTDVVSIASVYGSTSDSTSGGGSDTEDDPYTGTSGNDKIYGSSDGETLSGLAGNDLLSAGSGDDRLVGGFGIDKLTGGSGADAFVFDNIANGGADKIADFYLSQGDTLVFDSSVFTALAGADVADVVYIGTKATEPDHYLVLTTKGKLYYDADGSGTASKAILLAGIKGGLSGIDYDSFVIE